MRRLSVTALILVLFAAGAISAGPVSSCGENWRGSEPTGFRGPGFGEPHGNFGYRGCFGGSGGDWFGTDEWRQERFETRYDSFVEKYDVAVAGGPDFYASDLYEHMVNRLQRLVDSYDRLVSHEESGVDRLGDCIDRVNERIDQLNQWLEDHSDDEETPSCWHESLQDHLTEKIDALTNWLDTLSEKRDTLSANLETYVAFQDDLTAYLDTVISANTPADGAEEAIAAANPTLDAQAVAATVATGVMGAVPLATEAASAVPEPSSIVLLASVAALLLARRLWRVSR
jgi:hypothetical protein